MKIGLYGLPCAGKSFILDKIDFLEVCHGSSLLYEIEPDFAMADEATREIARKRLADTLSKKCDFIMDGHYAFGNQTVFTEADGALYDVFLYLFIDPAVIRNRMKISSKNQKYLGCDIAKWQEREASELREYCHLREKDFYVIDNPPLDYFDDVTLPLQFIQAIIGGFSSLKFAKECARDIQNSTGAETIILADGDKTLTIEDSSQEVFGYKTHLFDGNFYSGYQSWKQWLKFSVLTYEKQARLPIHLRKELIDEFDKPVFILTSGHNAVWEQISKKIGAKFYYGNMMSAETKYFITRFLQEAGRKVIAYGDSINDYYMLKQADEGYLIRKKNGSVSRTLKNRDLGGLHLV